MIRTWMRRAAYARYLISCDYEYEVEYEAELFGTFIDIHMISVGAPGEMFVPILLANALAAIQKGVPLSQKALGYLLYKKGPGASIESTYKRAMRQLKKKKDISAYADLMLVLAAGRTLNGAGNEDAQTLIQDMIDSLPTKLRPSSRQKKKLYEMVKISDEIDQAPCPDCGAIHPPEEVIEAAAEQTKGRGMAAVELLKQGIKTNDERVQAAGLHHLAEAHLETHKILGEEVPYEKVLRIALHYAVDHGFPVIPNKVLPLIEKKDFPSYVLLDHEGISKYVLQGSGS